MALHIGDHPGVPVKFYCQGDRVYPCFRTEGRIWYWRPARSQYRIESVSLRYASQIWRVQLAANEPTVPGSCSIGEVAILEAHAALPLLEFKP